MSEREARVSWDSDGHVLGVTLFIGGDSLPDAVAEQEMERISYTVENGRVILQV
jgi:hypothetical protein